MKRRCQITVGMLAAVALFCSLGRLPAQEDTLEAPPSETPVFELGGQAQEVVNQLTLDTPENAARIYMDAMRRGDWKETARLMHPEALAKLKDVFKPLMASPELRVYADNFLGVKNVTEFAKLSGAQTWEKFLSTMLGRSSDLKSTLQNSSYEIIGHVEETPTISHVVYRMKTTTYGVSFGKTSVMTFKRHNNNWRGLLSGELEGITSILAKMGKSAARKP